MLLISGLLGDNDMILQLEKGLENITGQSDEAMFYGDRPGEPTEWHECYRPARAVPRHLTFITRYEVNRQMHSSQDKSISTGKRGLKC